jgi:O-antigen/teichoic acid export membrane protein
MSDPTPTPHSHREQRARAVRKGAGFGVVARVLSVACTLAQVPIALHYLGTEGFGLWMTLAGISGLLAVGDFGLSLGAKTLLADAHGRDDPAALRALAGEAMRQVMPFAAGVALLGTGLAWSRDWHGTLQIASPELAAQLPWALTGLALAAGATLPAALAASLAAAVQLSWVQHAAAATTSAATLALVAIGAAWDAPWLVFVLGTLALPVLINGLIWLGLRRHLRWTGAPPPRPAPEIRQELRRLGRWFFVPQLGALFATLGLPVAVAAVGGPAAATAFNLLQRIFGLVNQAHWMALSALWPAYSEAHARRDYPWLHQASRKSWQATFVLFVPATILLALLMPWLVRFWVGAVPAELTPGLLGASALWFGLLLVGQPPAILLNGLGQVRGMALYGTAGHLVSLAGMVAGGRLAGPAGVVAGMTAGYLLVGLPCVIAESRRALGRMPA